MRVSASVKKICRNCKIIRRKGVVRVICTDPRHKQDKTYRVQVEGVPTPEKLQALRDGVNEAEAFARDYAVLARDARQAPDTACPWQEGLYLNSGHGSRGLITAPLSGELLASWLNNEPLPVPRTVAEACHPNRYLLRRLVRGK